MSRKERSLHIYSLFALVLVIVSFFVLGGGTQTNVNAMEKTYDINMDIPDSKEVDLASNRFDAEKKEEIRNQEQSHREMMQQNSFNIIESKVKDSSIGARENSQVRQIHKVSNPSISEDVKMRKTENKSDKKDAIMRRKRAQLEKELGVNLSDYGYTKYENHKEETDELELVAETEEPISSKTGGFYGLDSESDGFESDVRAVVHGDHKNIKSGSIVKLRLLEELVLDGVSVPKNTFVYGKLTFGSGRGIIKIQNINYRNKILQFKGTVYDSDGFEGIYVPDNIVSDTKSKAASAAVGDVDINVGSKSKMINSTISSIGEVIKSAVQGSIRESKISISSNYSVTIKRIK